MSGFLERVSQRIPLTPSGVAVLIIGALSFGGALVVGWLELFVVAAGCLIALLVSIPFILGRSRLRLERTLVPDRVTAGESARSSLLAVNDASVPAPRRQVIELVSTRTDSRTVPLELPTLAPGAQHAQSFSLPSQRRGIVKVGPARITKSDPFRLMQRDVGQTGVDTLWVQPRVVPCASFAAGITKDVEGPTFDTSPAGDVAFHAVRPYQMGDDARHVHWLATARTGEMMVRHYVDNRQPYLSVVLDTNPLSYGGDETQETTFDVAVEVAASLVVSALHERRPASLHIGERSAVGRHHPASPQDVLDALTTADADPSFDMLSALPRLIAAERESSVVVAVTGSRDLQDFLIPISILRRSSYVAIVRVLPEDVQEPSAMLGGARVIAVSSLDDFAALAKVVSSR